MPLDLDKSRSVVSDEKCLWIEALCIKHVLMLSWSYVWILGEQLAVPFVGLALLLSPVQLFPIREEARLKNNVTIC